MKPYVPSRMINAVLKVEKEHPLVGSAPGAIEDGALKELVLLIDSKPMDSLKDFSAVISRRESNALCRYIGTNAYNIDLKKIEQVIWFCMNPANYETLFRVWQQFPACSGALYLLGAFDQDQYRTETFPVKQGLLRAWANASRPIAAVAQTGKDLGTGKIFREKMESIGFLPDGALTQLCYQQFFSKASIAQIREEGDFRLSNVLGQSDKAVQEEILIHLLEFGEMAERQVLPGFKETYQKAFSLWKGPHSNLFPLGHQRAYETYVWWYNYYQLESAFGSDADYRRINYWKQYLHKCSCFRNRMHSMLVMDFGSYVVTEFEGGGAVYIFDAEYFKSTVSVKVRLHNNTGALKSWLVNHSNYKDRQEHRQNWETNQTISLRRFNIV